MKPFPSVIYVPQMADRFDQTQKEYWLSCAARWDARAGVMFPKSECLDEAAYCRAQAKRFA